MPHNLIQEVNQSQFSFHLVGFVGWFYAVWRYLKLFWVSLDNSELHSSTFHVLGLRHDQNSAPQLQQRNYNFVLLNIEGQ